MLDIISETALVASRPPRDTLSDRRHTFTRVFFVQIIGGLVESSFERFAPRRSSNFSNLRKITINLLRGAPSKVTIAERMRVLYGFAVFSIEKKRREVVLSTPLSSSRGKCRLFTSNLGNNLQERREIWRMGALFGDTLDEHNVTGH